MPKEMQTMKKEEIKVKIIFHLAEQQLVFGIEETPKKFLVQLVGYTHEATKGFAIPFKELKDEGIVETSGSKCVRLTEKGIRLAPRDMGPPKTNVDAHKQFLDILRKKVKQMDKLEKLWDILADGEAHATDDLVAALGYQHANSKGFTVPKQEMNKLGLIEKVGKGAIRLSDKAFPCGRP